MRKLKGMVAIVTGGGSGIGRALALELARRGADVIITDLRPERVSQVVAELERTGARADGHVVDQTDPEAVRLFHGAVGERFERVDILCLNVGAAHTREAVETSLDEWRWALDVNLWSAVYMLNRFLPDLVAQRRGHVMLTASLAGLIGVPGAAAYSASKFAVVGLAESLRAELGKHRIGVTALCPGIVRTNFTRDGQFHLESLGIAREKIDWLWQRIGESPATVARRAVNGIVRNTGLVPSSFINVRVPWWLKRIAGDALADGLGFAWASQAWLQRRVRDRSEGNSNNQDRSRRIDNDSDRDIAAPTGNDRDNASQRGATAELH